MEDRNEDFISKLNVTKTYFDELKVVPRRILVRNRLREFEEK